MKKTFTIFLALILAAIIFTSCTFRLPWSDMPGDDDGGTTDVTDTDSENGEEDPEPVLPDETDETDENDPADNDETTDPADTDETDEHEEEALIEEGEVTVTSLDELKRYVDAGLFPEDRYDFFNRFLTEGWEFPEVNEDVTIDEYSFTFDLPHKWDNETEFRFHVAESKLETLPVGDYVRLLGEGMMYNYLSDPENPPIVMPQEIADNEYVRRVVAFLGITGEWRTQQYGAPVDIRLITDYITARYCGEDYSMSYEDYLSKAQAEFGIEGITHDQLGAFYSEEDGRIHVLGHGGAVRNYKVLGLTEENGNTVVTVQYMADMYGFVKSHKVAYTFSEDGKWISYEILEESKYEPFGYFI